MTYNLYKTESSEYGVTNFYQRRVDTDEGFDLPLCQCNDKLFINAEVFAMDFQGNKKVSCAISLVHENLQGEWCDLKIYSPDEFDLWNNIKHYESKLLKMWEVFNK